MRVSRGLWGLLLFDSVRGQRTGVDTRRHQEAYRQHPEWETGWINMGKHSFVFVASRESREHNNRFGLVAPATHEDKLSRVLWMGRAVAYFLRSARRRVLIFIPRHFNIWWRAKRFLFCLRAVGKISFLRAISQRQERCLPCTKTRTPKIDVKKILAELTRKMLQATSDQRRERQLQRKQPQEPQPTPRPPPPEKQQPKQKQKTTARTGNTKKG